MRNYFLTAVAAIALASPAAARDGSPYVGIEAGILLPRDGDLDIDIEGEDIDTDTSIDYKTGRDLDVIAGYDFGGFRLEGEIAWKRTRADEIEFEDDEEGDLQELGNPRVKVRSIMLNALADFAGNEGLGFYAGAGIGRARMRVEGDSDAAMAWQLIAGARMAISPNMDAGLKYRYFQTRTMRFEQDEEFDGEFFPVGLETRFGSHSLLASLIFNFGAPAAPPAPPPPPPPPPAAAPPATQTCPDGTVVLATEACPPPPPPPPPPAQGERG